MQDRKKELLKALAKIVKKYRGEKSISQISMEIDVSKSIWLMIERAQRDAQFSTIWRIAEALDIKPSFLVNELENELGENFSFIENTSGINRTGTYS